MKSLKSAIPEIQGLVVAGVDGLAIASDMPEGESTRAAAMAATALGLSRRIAQTVHLGDFQ
ncbi:MAG: roadblock/LC7 domain-containing protein, partial [Acidobacteriota bacterium]